MGEILNLFQEVPANIRLNGMAHYYSFDKVSGTTLYDMIANGQNGTISGAISATGVTGNCLYFDGASNVNLSGITFNSNIFSLSFWIHSASISTTTKIIFDTYPTRFNLAWTYNSSGAKISLYLGGSWVAFDAVPDDGQWHHICLNINNTNAVLYLDGVQYGAAKTIGSFDLSGITTVKLGSDYNNANYFEGFIDDFKIYNRNLTYDEIYKLYNVNAPTIDMLSGIKVTYVQQVGDYYTAGTARAGFENETDADGGTNLANLTSGSVIDLTSLSINWSDRYNYRIGGANIYRITEIILYKNGVASESQTSLTLNSNILVGKEGHCGFNINPSSRNITHSSTAVGVGYPKWIT